MNAKKNASKGSLKNSITKNILLIITSGVVLLFTTLLLLHLYTRENESVEVPQVKGLQLREAQVLLKSRGLNLVIVDSLYEKDAVPGAIIEQVPVANSKTKAGREVFLTIYSSTPPQVVVPQLVDYSHRQAEAVLKSMGFEELTVEEVPSEYKDLVKAIEYRGRELRPDEKIPTGSPLTIVVGNGIQPDSLEIDNEYSPSINGDSSRAIDKESATNLEEKAPIVDESFF